MRVRLQVFHSPFRFLVEAHHADEDGQHEKSDHEVRAGAQHLVDLVSHPEEQERGNHHGESPGRQHQNAAEFTDRLSFRLLFSSYQVSPHSFRSRMDDVCGKAAREIQARLIDLNESDKTFYQIDSGICKDRH